MLAIVEVPTCLANVGAIAGEALAIRFGSRGLIIYDGLFLLLEITLTLDGSSSLTDIESMLARAVAQLGVQSPGAQGATRGIHHAAPSAGIAPLGGDVDDTHISFGTITR